MWTVDDVGSPDKFKLTKGPSLNQKRFSAACGEMLDYFGNTIYIVAGGRDKHGNNLETVELLNSTKMDKWIMGKSWCFRRNLTFHNILPVDDVSFNSNSRSCFAFSLELCCHGYY